MYFKLCRTVETPPCRLPYLWFNTLRPRQNGRFFPDDVFKCFFKNENILILLNVPLKFVPIVPIDNIPSLVQIMAWRRPGDKPLSEPMVLSLLTHIYASLCLNGLKCNIWAYVSQNGHILQNCSQVNATQHRNQPWFRQWLGAAKFYGIITP